MRYKIATYDAWQHEMQAIGPASLPGILHVEVETDDVFEELSAIRNLHNDLYCATGSPPSCFIIGQLTACLLFAALQTGKNYPIEQKKDAPMRVFDVATFIDPSRGHYAQALPDARFIGHEKRYIWEITR